MVVHHINKKSHTPVGGFPIINKSVYPPVCVSPTHKLNPYTTMGSLIDKYIYKSQ